MKQWIISMHSLDILYYSLSLGFLVLVGFLSYAAYQLGQTFKHMSKVSRDVEDITHDVTVTKERIKWGVINGVVGLLQMFGSRKK